MDLQEMHDWVFRHDEEWQYNNDLTPINILHYALALCEEASEVGGQVKKWIRYETLPEGGKTYPLLSREEVWNARRKKALIELVDLGIYFVKVLHQLEYTPEDFREAWAEKFNVLHGRWSIGEFDCGYGCVAVTEE